MLHAFQVCWIPTALIWALFCFSFSNLPWFSWWHQQWQNNHSLGQIQYWNTRKKAPMRLTTQPVTPQIFQENQNFHFSNFWTLFQLGFRMWLSPKSVDICHFSFPLLLLLPWYYTGGVVDIAGIVECGQHSCGAKPSELGKTFCEFVEGVNITSCKSSFISCSLLIASFGNSEF